MYIYNVYTSCIHNAETEKPVSCTKRSRSTEKMDREARCKSKKKEKDLHLRQYV